MKLEKTTAIICYYLFLCTATSHCLCISDGTGPIQCTMSVITSTGNIVILQPQLNVDYPTCSSSLTIDANATYGNSRFTVVANSTTATVRIIIIIV